MSQLSPTRRLSAAHHRRQALRARRIRETALTVTAITAIFGVLFIVTRPPDAWQQQARAPARADDEVITGTIRLAPDRHDRCTQLLFDNRSGAMREVGRMSCDATSARAGADETLLPGSYLGSIRDGFRGR
jgi:hypothetical protein